MVHTRHTRDVEPDSPPRFLSLESARSRKLQSRAADVDEHDSDHSAVYGGKQDGIFDGRVESRLRPRTGPRRAYNYVYGDSSDDEMTMSRGRRSRVPGGPISKSRGGHSRYESPRETRKTRRGRISSDEEEEESPPQRGQWYGKRSLRQRNVKAEEDEEGDEDGDEENHDEEDEEDDDANNSALRRSSRLRVKPYRFRGGLQAQGNGDNSVGIDRPKRRRNSDGEGNDEEEYEDMYSRVKRARTKISDPRAPHSASDDDDKNDSEAETQQRRSYSLREHKPRTQLYMAPAIESKRRTKQQSLFRETPPRQTRHKARESYRSPAHRKLNFRKRHAFHGSSSSTSSDSDSGTETSDEQHFSRRKVKSLAKARSRICPLNFTKDMVTGPVKDRVRAGASLADVDPMEIDRSVTFDSVGGLQKHIMALKEMVVFPLLYPEFYDHFKVAPSRGVLFYGPPGTGKTLVARALANECSRGSQKVAFFMRKGADCLSKWVGEAERQLRLLFDKAYEMRPSIIFFDEIDGLAPVRSSRQDQIHSSIVSTLLALMDGIDSRGEIVIIGATNRIDSIDPALRRPGRFDKEFHFPLPSLLDRKKILQIHTKNWSPLLRDDFLLELSEKCAGYCGADVKCLVTEATQNALRRHYPQIYTTSDKLQLNIPSIQLTARDFAQAMATIVPAAQRAVANPAMALEASVRPLLSRSLLKLQDSLNNRFPYAKADRRSNAASAAANEQGAESTHFDLELASDEEDNTPSIFRSLARGSKSSSNQLQPATPFLAFSSSASSFPTVFRPRMLVCGQAGQGQTVHLAPAALHLMEHLPVHTLNSATLFAASAKMPEEACANVFLEAKRTAPSIIYMPYVSELWHVVTDSLRVTFLTFVRSMNPSTPVLILATCEASYIDLDDQLKQLFSHSGGEVVEVGGPTAEERRQFFVDLILQQPLRPPSTHKQAEKWQTGSVKFFPQKGIKAKKYNNLLVVEGTAETELSPVSEICRAFDSETRSLIVHPRGRYTKLTCAASARHPETDWSTTCFSDTRQQTAQSKNSRSQPRNSRSQPVKNSTSVTTKQCSVPLSQIQTPLRQAIENQRNSRIVTSAYSHISSKTNIQSRHSRNVTPCLSQTQLSSKNATPSTSRSTKSGSTVASSSSRSTGSRTAQNLANTSRSKAAGFSVTKNVAIGACCAKATKSVISRKSLDPSCTKLSRAAPSLSQAKTTSRSKAPPANSKPQKVVLALSARKKAPFYSPYSREASLGVCLKAAEVRKGYSTGKRSRASPAKKNRSSKSYNYNWKPRKKSYRGKQRKKYTNKNRRKKKYRPLRRSDNLNYNHSACSSISSFSVLQYPMAFVGYTKLYPSLKSPYNQHNFQSAGDHCGYLIGQQVASSPRSKRRARRVLEPLKKAPPPEPRRLTDKEQRKLIEQEDDTLRELRIFLRDILSKLGREKKFSIFTKPVDVDEVTDYYDIIKKPMDLSTIMANIDLHKYTTASTFLEDIFLISSNALEYNPDRGPTDRAIRHRACALRDMAMALLKAELDPEFEKTCHEIENSRKQRGVDGSRNAPAFYHTRPLGATALGLAGDAPLPPPAIPEGCRYSRRVRGLEADQTLPLEAVEKTVQVERSLLKEDKDVAHNVESSSQGEDSGSSQQTVIMNGDNDAEMTEELDKSMEEDCRPETVSTSVCKCPPAASPTPSKKLSPIHSGNSKGSLSKPLTPEEAKKARRVRAHQSPWCRTRRRRRHHSTPVDRHGLDHDHSHQGSDVEEEVSEGEDEERAILEGHDSPRRDHSGSSRKEHRDGWHGGHHREHSPVSAANPANVNVSGRTRRSLDQVPTPTQPALEVSNKPVEVPFNKPAEVPFNKPAEVPFNKPAEVAFNKPEEVPSKAPSDSKPKESSTAEDSGSKQKPGAVRNLEVDLLTAAADSGVGSESNGDSRDSLDHNNSNRSGAANSTEKEREDGTANNSTSFARTRSRTQNPMQLNALAALEVETRTVQVDKARLDKLLESTVAATKGFTVERLQHLFSSLSCAIYHHRQEFDKTALVEEMEKVVRNFCVELEARH